MRTRHASTTSVYTIGGKWVINGTLQCDVNESAIRVRHSVTLWCAISSGWRTLTCVQYLRRQAAHVVAVGRLVLAYRNMLRATVRPECVMKWCCDVRLSLACRTLTYMRLVPIQTVRKIAGEQVDWGTLRSAGDEPLSSIRRLEVLQCVSVVCV